MSVIQSIRDKYARWAVVAICISLLGFIMMDAFSGRGGIGNSSTTIGSVNGDKIDYIDFERKVKAQEAAAQQQGYTREQLQENVWNGEVMQTVMDEQFEELGMTVGKKELTDLLFGANPPQDLKQRFTDPNTGVYDANQASQLINNIRKSGKPEERTQLNDYLENLMFSRKVEKYTSLLTNSNYFPKWFLEKQNVDNSLIARTSYVMAPYTSIPDSAVTISDKDIQVYIDDNKKDFDQKEEARTINYVVFDAAPTAPDSAAVREQIALLKQGLETTTDSPSYIVQQGSSIEFLDAYVAGSKIQIEAKDSIFALADGGVYGPYLDGGSYVLAKKIDEKVLPDSARVRHILIQTVDPQAQRVLLDDSTAKKRIDSIETAINNGADFDSLAMQFSNDQGSAAKGGVYEYFPQGQMVKAFNEFAFEKPVGSRGVVETEFGYHLIEVLGQKGSEPNYKIAYLAKAITPSSETDNAASSAASAFAGNSSSLKSFNENFDKNLKGKGINKLVAQDLLPGASEIQGLGTSRTMVRSIFEADQGDVLQPERVGAAYVVAAVTEVNEAGTQSVAKARAVVEPVLRNKKKAEQIKQKLGKITTLEAASTALAQPIQVADSLRFNGSNPTFGFESKVIGASFNQNNKGKVVPEAIEGQSGIYVLRVESIGTTPVQSGGIDEQRKMLQMQARQQAQYRSPLEALKNAADIKDNRATFY
jgi:peptidyl-prolyl cis-trans isomerase D